ncbi:MAG TPA: tetratricopeptide repeat protein [Polyangia bacterium]|nr:tetratricopeptide repeat protein [Polyangia bacterium]
MRRLLLVLMTISGAAGFLSNVRDARAASTDHAYGLVEEQRIEEAAKEIDVLVKNRPHDPEVAFVEGDLLLHRGEYARAADRLGEAAGKLRGRVGEEAKELRDLAHATDEVTKGYVALRGPHFVVWHQPGRDDLLAPYALETLEKALAALGDDLGWRPTEPVRVEIYPEVADLARVSTLTLKEIETSGTIALCKYNRLMIVSPRALIAGYPWRDTLNHELTHYVVTRMSHNTVPIWLHEGIAKYEEQRWRGPSGGALTPVMEHLLASAIARKHLITFAEMHPSMAKLPSQEDTALAFAEVYTVVDFLHERDGWAGVRGLIKRFTDADRGKASAPDPAEFENAWRTWLRGRKFRMHPGILPAETQLRFKKGAGKPTEASEDDSARIGEERARKFARLGGMLRARHRLVAAAIEYEKAAAIVGAGHPSVANKLARTYLELGDPTKAIAAAEPALELYPDQAAPNATLGEAWLRKNDNKKAAQYLEAALAVNPFDPAVHCGLAQAYRALKDGRADAEAGACQTLK